MTKEERIREGRRSAIFWIWKGNFLQPSRYPPHCDAVDLSKHSIQYNIHNISPNFVGRFESVSLASKWIFCLGLVNSISQHRFFLHRSSRLHFLCHYCS